MTGDNHSHKPLKKILMVAACSLPAPQGSQLYIHAAASALAREGMEVDLITYPGNGCAPLHPGIRHIACPHNGNLPEITAGPRLAKLALDWKMKCLLAQTLHQSRPDLILAHNIEALHLAAPLSHSYHIPLIYAAHGVMSRELETYFTTEPLKLITRSIGGWLDRRAAEHLDGIHILDPTARTYWRETGIPDERILTHPPSFDLAAYDAITPMTANFDIEHQSPLIVYTGNFDHYQNLPLALSSFDDVRSKIPSAQLVLACHRESGAYPAMRKLSSKIKGIYFYHVNHFAEMKFLLQKADILIQPRSLPGGFPMKILNYMAAKKPIVACDNTPLLVHEHNALLVDSTNSCKCGDAILRVLSDRHLANALAHQARGTVEKEYSGKKNINQLIHFFHTIILACCK